MISGGVIPVVCKSCRRGILCRMCPEMMHKALVAWAKDVVAPSCGEFLPRAERGCLED